jgi:DNA-binding PadR family transcriptional regulator
MGRGRKPPIDDAERFAALHHLGGGMHHGGGPVFGGGRGRARRGDVRAALLLLLTEEPRNGYQLMQAIEDRSGGRWRPSPGSVYPTLAQLEDQGFVRSTDNDGGRIFEITDAGREHIARHDHPSWVGDEAPQFPDLKFQVKQLNIAVAMFLRAGSAKQIDRAAETLAETKRTLYRILAEDGDE